MCFEKSFLPWPTALPPHQAAGTGTPSDGRQHSHYEIRITPTVRGSQSTGSSRQHKQTHTHTYIPTHKQQQKRTGAATRAEATTASIPQLPDSPDTNNFIPSLQPTPTPTLTTVTHSRTGRGHRRIHLHPCTMHHVCSSSSSSFHSGDPCSADKY